MKEPWQGPLEKIDDCRWRLPKSYKQGMRVDGMIYADEKLLKDIKMDKSLEQPLPRGEKHPINLKGVTYILGSKQDYAE